MKKSILSIATLVALASSLNAYTYNITDGIQQIDSVTSIKDMSAFNNSCVDYIWTNDYSDTDNPVMKLYSANGIDYKYTQGVLSNIDVGEYFWIKASGDCSIDITESAITVYEDAENYSNSKWTTFGSAAAAGVVTNIQDDDKQSRVISLEGDGYKTGYRLGDKNPSNTNAWNNTEDTVLRWSMKVDEWYKVLVNVETTFGLKTLQYLSRDYDKGINSNGKTITLGLGRDSRDGTWQTFTRDLEADLQKHDANNSIISVNAFSIKASALVDDVVMISSDDVVTPPDDNTTIEHNGFMYGEVISPITGRTWLDRNLGASQACTALDDEACYGDYYQWGRDADGHEKIDSNTTLSLATVVNNIGNGEFIINTSSPSDWASVDSDGSIRGANWSKTDGTSVCPVGYRIPIGTELKAEILNESISNSVDVFNSFLKFPSAGNHGFNDGLLRHEGYFGAVWSSNIVGDYSSALRFNLNDEVDFISQYYRAYGFSVRCIKD